MHTYKAPASKRSCRLFSVVAISILLAASTSWAGNLPDITKLADASQLFATEPSVTVNADVVEAMTMPFSAGMNNSGLAVVLTLKNARGTFLAYMGPQRLLEKWDTTFHAGEHLTLKGVQASFQGEEILITSAYAVENLVLALRGSDGYFDSFAEPKTTWECPKDTICLR